MSSLRSQENTDELVVSDTARTTRPCHWPKEDLGKLFTLQLGKMLNKKARETVPKFPYLGNKDVQWGHFDFSDLREMHFDEQEREKFRLIPGDLLVCEGGEIGRTALWTGEFGCYYQKAIHRLRVQSPSKVDPRFILHFMRFAASHGLFADLTSQSSIAHLTREKLARLKVPLPSLLEQRRIAAILSSMDGAIEKTQAVIDQVQVVKRGLMQELLTRGLPRRHTRFKQTEIGEMPEKWDLVSLTDCGAKVTSGSRGWAKYYSNDGALFLRITNLARNTIRLQLDSIRRVALPQGSTESKRTRVEAGDLVVSITADLGMVGIIPDEMGEAYVNQHLALVRLAGCRLNPEFAGYFLATAASRNRFNRLNDSGAKAGLNLPTIMKLTVPRPPRDEQDSIVRVLAATEDRLEVEVRRLVHLAATKRALMSVLLAGELRVARCTEVA